MILIILTLLSPPKYKAGLLYKIFDSIPRFFQLKSQTFLSRLRVLNFNIVEDGTFIHVANSSKVELLIKQRLCQQTPNGPFPHDHRTS